jgi:hypothetical protein
MFIGDQVITQKEIDKLQTGISTIQFEKPMDLQRQIRKMAFMVRFA